MALTNKLLDRLTDELRRLDAAEHVTAGAYVYAYCRSIMKDDSRSLDAIRDRIEARTLTRAVDTQSLSDNPGIVPELIVGDLVTFVDSTRPVVTSSRRLPMPERGKTFDRPVLTETTDVDVQASEHSELASNKLSIDPLPVNKKTHGGVVDISEQDIDWTDPALLQVVLEDLANSYSRSTERQATAAVEAGVTTNTQDLSLTADSDAFFAALALAAGAVYGSAGELPDTLYASVDRWVYLVSLMDDAGRPLFPTVGAANAPGSLDLASFGGNASGLRLVVSPAFSTNFFAVAASRKVETFETPKGLIMVPAPHNLSVATAFRGYFSTNVFAEGLCGLAPAGS